MLRFTEFGLYKYWIEMTKLRKRHYNLARKKYGKKVAVFLSVMSSYILLIQQIL
jgi:hypothetical protein